MSRISLEELRTRIENRKGEIIYWRREFHRHPEVAFQEHWTQQTLQKILHDWGIESQVIAGTGLRAIIQGQEEGPTVALRADMDALPLQEEGKKPVLSEVPGAAHCCGHDGHMAILLGAARALLDFKKFLPGRIVLIFQPAEELPPGGAKPMIEEGALEEVDAIFGLHLWQPLPTGQVGLLAGPMMAQADNFEIEVRGQGGHGSMPHLTIDPIWVAAQVITNIQGLVSRETDPLHPLVISFGTIQGGTIYNIIPEKVELTGTVRTLDTTLQARIEERLAAVCELTAQAWRAEIGWKYQRGYPVLVNHEREVELVREVVRKIWGEKRLIPIKPVMGGEDFAYYLQKIPGAFLFFGAGSGKSY
ncbi:MAG TPA: amidohydrolase, partial [Candidatus Aminicenantes bacterium]|nr:amidohydrolase [Candidatus Aminicenantes bacterium]